MEANAPSNSLVEKGLKDLKSQWLPEMFSLVIKVVAF